MTPEAGAAALADAVEADGFEFFFPERLASDISARQADRQGWMQEMAARLNEPL